MDRNTKRSFLRALLLVSIVMAWTLVSHFINKMAGVEFHGWYALVWDAPAYFAGIFLGYYIGKWNTQKAILCRIEELKRMTAS